VSQMDPWRILVVDDEEDVHAVTGLALKRRTWKGAAFTLVGARSGAEAKKTLASQSPFHVALVDVVMETDRAGLDLCEHIRNTQPRSTRIILRTGQPGVAPEEQVLNDFDIDYYLAKTEVTQDRLYTTVRACLRSSQDVGTIMMVSDQLQDYVRQLQEDDSLDTLVQSFSSTLGFLEAKYGGDVALYTHLADAHNGECRGPMFDKDAKEGKLDANKARDVGLAKKDVEQEFKPEKVDSFVVVRFSFVPRAGARGEKRKGLFHKLLGGTDGPTASGCVVFKPVADLSDRSLQQFIYDLRLFCQNWKLAYQLLCAQKAITDAAAGIVW
jgi:CheY-like chemotaxis protein